MFITRIFRNIVRRIREYRYYRSSEAKALQKRINELRRDSRNLAATASLIEASNLKISSIPESVLRPPKEVEIFEPQDINHTDETLVGKRRRYQGGEFNDHYKIEDQFDFLCNRAEIQIKEGNLEGAVETIQSLKTMEGKIESKQRRLYVQRIENLFNSSKYMM